MIDPSCRFSTWLPLYLLFVLAVTLFPFWVHCVPLQARLQPPAVVDLVQNVVLFVPLGIALRRVSLAWTLGAAFVFSGLIEIAQPWVFRVASPWDVGANAVGAMIGRMTLLPRLGRFTPLRAAAIVGALFVAILAARATRTDNDFSNWSPMPLVIGNEATETRPWAGTLAEFAVFDTVPNSAPDWGDGRPPAWSAGGPILWMRFESPRAMRVDGPEGPRVLAMPEPPAGATLESNGLHTIGGLWKLPDSLADHLTTRLMASAQLALFARLMPASLELPRAGREAEGPGRIISLSQSTADRNFTLAQGGAQLAFRVRTPTTGHNGTSPAVENLGAPLTLGSHRAWAVFDGTTSYLEVDGSCRGERLIAAGRISHFGLLVAGALVLGVGLAAAAFGAGCGGRRSRMRVLRCAAGGTCFWFAAWATGVWSHLPYFDAWAVGFAAAAVLAALPLARAMECSSSLRSESRV